MTIETNTNESVAETKAIRSKIKEVCGLVGSSWVRVGDLAHEVFGHCAKHNHSSDLAATMFFQLDRANHPAILRAYRYAAMACIAVKFTPDENGKIKGKKQEKEWKEIEAERSALAFIQLKEKGLASFLPEKKEGAKKVKGVKSAFEITVENLEDAILTMESNPSTYIQEQSKVFRHKFNELYGEVLDYSQEVLPTLAAKLKVRDARIATKIAKLHPEPDSLETDEAEEKQAVNS